MNCGVDGQVMVSALIVVGLVNGVAVLAAEFVLGFAALRRIWRDAVVERRATTGTPVGGVTKSWLPRDTGIDALLDMHPDALSSGQIRAFARGFQSPV